MKLKALLRLTLMTASHCAGAVLGDAGVVDENVDATEVLDNLCHNFLGLVEVGGVGGIALALHAEGGDFGLGGLAVFVYYEVGECDIGTLLREAQSDGATDAACGAGDEGGFSFEKFHFLLDGFMFGFYECKSNEYF